MKWLLVCLGALMIVVGGSCILSGYPIVEVERGWTLVISGTTALSAGAIILGLALVAARIENVSRGLAFSMRPPVEAPGATASPDPSPPVAPAADDKRREQEPTAQDLPEAGVSEAATPIPRPVRVRNWQAPPFLKRAPQPELSQRADLDETAAALAASSTGEPAPHEEPPAPSPPPPPTPAEPVADLAAAAEEAVHSPQEIAAPAKPEPESESLSAPAPGPSFRRFPLRSLTLPRGPWPDSPVTSAAEDEAPPPSQEFNLAGEAAAPEGKPTAEDWFERALAGLDEGAEPALQHPGAEHAELASDSLRHTIEPAPHEPGEEPAAPDIAPAEVALETPAVIGRYETEGTTYVMYADGSIDAETATGVYRFESLAALKEHIEGPA